MIREYDLEQIFKEMGYRWEKMSRGSIRYAKDKAEDLDAVLDADLIVEIALVLEKAGIQEPPQF